MPRYLFRGMALYELHWSPMCQPVMQFIQWCRGRMSVFKYYAAFSEQHEFGLAMSSLRAITYLTPHTCAKRPRLWYKHQRRRSTTSESPLICFAVGHEECSCTAVTLVGQSHNYVIKLFRAEWALFVILDYVRYSYLKFLNIARL